MTDCIFCKIVVGEIPSYKIYEDEEYLAFLDITPIVAGHTLVIPKKHYRWVWDVEEIGDFYAVVSKLARHFQSVGGKEMVASAVWGEAVPHAHVHLLPGNEGNLDQVLAAWSSARLQLSHEQFEKVKEKYKMSLELRA